MQDSNNFSDSNNNINEVYEYVKLVDEKCIQNDKTMKFLVSQQTEQMKELIQSKSDNLSRFFEEAIRLQTETVRGTYESIISELKSNFEYELKNKDIDNFKIYNQKIETLKAQHENEKNCNKAAAQQELEDLRDYYEKKLKKDVQDKADEVYINTIKECEIQKQQELQKLTDFYEEKLKKETDEVYENTKKEYEDRITAINEWNERVLNEKLEENREEYTKKLRTETDCMKKHTEELTRASYEKGKEEEKEASSIYYQKEIERLTKESYENGIADAKLQAQEEIKTKLITQAEYYEQKIDRLKKEAYENGKTEAESEAQEETKIKLTTQAEYYEQEIQKIKNEMQQKMDDASRRKEEELKLLIDFYENKMKPFKKFIDIQETTNLKIQNIQNRIRTVINKK